jgi:peroxiredoxin
MRFAAVFVPLGVALAVAGGIMFYASLKPARAEALAIVAEVRHPVSRQMLLDASVMSEKTAPFFKLKDAHGIDVQIGGEGKRPQFVYFILLDCPCSLDAQPLFNSLYRRYKGKVDFIGIINCDKAKAIDFAGETTTLHPIVCDPDHKIVKAYGALQSTYNLVIRPDGTIVKMWPGFWRDQLQELDKTLAKLVGETSTPFDAQYAPIKKTSGCYF